MRARKYMALGLSAALAASGISLVTAGTASAAAVGTIYCNTFNDGPTFKTTVTPGATFAFSPAAAPAGASVTLAYTATSGLSNGPSVLAAGAVQPQVPVDIAWNGATLEKVVLATPNGSYPAADVAEFANTGGFTASKTVTTKGSGVATATPKQLIVAAVGAADTYCSGADLNSPLIGDVSLDAAGYSTTGLQITDSKYSTPAAANPAIGSADVTFLPSATVATSTAQADGTQFIARNSGLFARALTLTGINFDASDASGTVEFCDTTGATCNDNTNVAGVTNSLVTDASGNLSGGIALPNGTTLATGARAIKISGLSASPVLVPVTVQVASISLTPSSGTINTAVTVAGTGFNTGGTGAVYGSTSSVQGGTDNTADAAVSFTADNTGAFSKVLTVTDATTQSIVAAQALPILGPPNEFQASAFKPFTYVADTTAPTGTAKVAPTAGPIGTTSKVTLSGIADNGGASKVKATVNWGDGSAAQVLAIGATTATHKYAKLGSFPVKVTLKDQTGNTSAALTAGTVAIKDTTKPVAALKVPSKATKGASWKSVKFTVTDAGGSGVRSVSVKLIEKKDGKWYFYNGSAWKKTTSKAKATSKAKWLVDASAAGGWAVSVKKPGIGKLYVTYFASDKAGNKSAPKTKSQSIKS